MCVAENMRYDPAAGARDERTVATKPATRKPRNMVVILKSGLVLNSHSDYTCISSHISNPLSSYSKSNSITMSEHTPQDDAERVCFSVALGHDTFDYLSRSDSFLVDSVEEACETAKCYVCFSWPIAEFDALHFNFAATETEADTIAQADLTRAYSTDPTARATCGPPTENEGAREIRLCYLGA
jgi:hypothetical protein